MSRIDRLNARLVDAKLTLDLRKLLVEQTELLVDLIEQGIEIEKTLTEARERAKTQGSEPQS